MKMTTPRVSRHYAACIGITEKFNLIAGLQNPHLEPRQLEEYGIQVSEISLEDAENFPTYFLPASSSKLHALEDQRPGIPAPPTTFNDFRESCRPLGKFCRAGAVGSCLREQLLEERVEGEGKNCLLDYTKWELRVKRYKYESQLLENEGMTPEAYPQEWKLATKLDTFDDNCPHIACISHHGVWDVKLLLRSEILIVIGMIIDRMGLPFSQNHLVFPILMVSLIGTQGRIIQAHFNGNKLYVEHSRLYEFKEYDKETVDLFLRWLMNEPIGDTAIIVTEEEEGSSSSDQSLMDIRSPSQRSRAVSLAA